MDGFQKTVIALVAICVIGLATLVSLKPSDTAVLPVALSPRSSPDLDERPASSRAPRQTMTVEDLDQVFRRLDYNLESVVSGMRKVPRLLLSEIPDGFDALGEAKHRKRVFTLSVLPLILEVNGEYRRDRRRLQRLRAALDGGAQIDALDRLWLTATSLRYNVEEGQFDQLLQAVDEIPPSLALVQAAVESGWGTSRFLREGNALFGQWTFGENGLIPDKRDHGKRHRVRSFDALIDGVRAYMRNLNGNPAYEEFRVLRAALRRAGQTPDGLTLAGTLLRYSERGQAYVEDLRGIISTNGLQRFDSAVLEARRVDIRLARFSP